MILASWVPLLMRSRVYLDWNATAPLHDAARRAVVDALDAIGNPSSVHAEGRAARQIIERARVDIADLIGAEPDDIVLTSGATEANATVLAGGWDTVFVAGIEHDSVRAAATASGARIIPLATDAAGLVDQSALIEAVLRDARPLGRALLTLQAANNETGIRQDLAPVFAFAHEHGIITHCDAVQIAGRLPFDRDDASTDLVSLSAHKLGGPKGVGALAIRDKVALSPLIVGGGQQRYRRAGTENVPGIAGFGAAARAARAALANTDAIARMRDDLERRLLALTPEAIIVGATSPRLPNTTCVALPGRLAEMLVIKFDLAGIAISAGAACSSGKVAASPVLASMGLPPDVVRGAVRLSLGATTSAADIDRVCDVWAEIAHTAAARKHLHTGQSSTGVTPPAARFAAHVAAPLAAGGD